jgi:DNA-binding response OmpR family regulator
MEKRVNAGAERPDLILMDIQLPLLDGYEATRRIKADPALTATPIIVVTSNALSGDEIKARDAGCDAYAPKPYSPRQLLAKIREFLPQRLKFTSADGICTGDLIARQDGTGAPFVGMKMRHELQSGGKPYSLDIDVGLRWIA